MLNISKQVYVGWDTLPKTGLPTAHIIPYGDSLNEKKKLQSFTQDNSYIYEHDNRPLPGFTLAGITNNYVSPVQSWKIIDPRGFIVIINSQNMFDILSVTGITEGLIQEKCVWARNDSETNMRLIPISSEDYINAVENTDLINNRISMDQVNIGDVVLLQNGMEGVYRGTLSLYCTLNKLIETGPFKAQTLLRNQVIEINKGKFYYQSDAKILKVIKSTTQIITAEESANQLNETITNTIFTSFDRIPSFYFNSRNRVKFVSTTSAATVSIKLEEISIHTAESHLIECREYSDLGTIIVETNNGIKNLVTYPADFFVSPLLDINIDRFDIIPISTIETDRLIILPEHNKKLNKVGILKKYLLSDFSKFYRIIKYVKNEPYI